MRRGCAKVSKPLGKWEVRHGFGYMDISDKLAILSQIYDIYDSFSADLRAACVKGCAACCTQNVTMTTLEGYMIANHLISTGQLDIFGLLHQSTKQERFLPIFTTNELAALCMQDKDPPEENGNRPLAECPFLSNNECLIYGHRPFGCRCFFSTEKCDNTACAVVDPFLITVNTLFLQFIEHVDAGGFGGNMIDVLLFLELETQRKQYEENTSLSHPQELSVNRSIPRLLIPPEHLSRIQPILHKLSNIRIPRGSIGNSGQT